MVYFRWESVFVSRDVNTTGKAKRTRETEGFFFIRGRKALLVSVFLGLLFLLSDVHIVRAGWWENMTSPTALVNGFIYIFFEFFSWIVSVAAGIFVWVINASTFTKLMNAGAIYEVWVVVRDFLNIFFILVLLFSAFATIFGLDKYEYKKTLPTLIVMAFLVNFSFPISRFVIDLANVPMYLFSQSIFGVNSPNEITSGILSGTKMQNILIPGNADKSLASYSTTHLLAATICMFLFGISFLVLALLMLIRMIALAILVMFSPIGFVGMITPALSGFASGWWNKLFKWAFYGPLAVMFVLVAVIVMKSAGETVYPTTGSAFPSSGSSVNDSMISAVAFFTIPIVLFWIAITSTEKYSSDMSGMSIKFGSNISRKVSGWARRGALATALSPYTGAKAILKQRGVTGGIQDAWKNRCTAWLFGKNYRDAREMREALISGGLSGGKPGWDAAREMMIRKRAQEMVEKNKKTNRRDSEIQEDLNSTGTSEKDIIKRRAAALTMLDRETLTNVDNFSKALQAVGNDMEGVSRIVRKAPKEMLENSKDMVSSFEAINKTGMNDNVKKQLKGQIIEKAGSGALAKTGGDYQAMVSALGNDDLEKALQSKMTKEKNIAPVLRYKVRGASNDDEKFAIYSEVLKNFNAKDLGEQVGLMDDKDFREFFRRKGALQQFNAEFYYEYMRAAKGGDRAAFSKAVIAS